MPIVRMSFNHPPKELVWATSEESWQDMAAMKKEWLEPMREELMAAAQRSSRASQSRRESRLRIFAHNYHIPSIFQDMATRKGISLLDQVGDIFSDVQMDTLTLFGNCEVSNAICAHKEDLRLDDYRVINSLKDKGSDDTCMDTPRYSKHEGGDEVIGMAVLKLLMEAAGMEATEVLASTVGCSRTASVVRVLHDRDGGGEN
jgi:hypothetical protein